MKARCFIAVVLAALVVAGASAPLAAQTVPAVPAQQTTASPVQAQPADAPAASAPRPARPVTNTGGLRELSPWSMFLSADVLVQFVMISLAFASLVTWTIFLAKSIQLHFARRRLQDGLARIANARTLAEAQIALGTRRGLLNALLSIAIQEVRLSADNPVKAGIQERVASHFVEVARIESRAIRYGMGVLATIGSTSPFVGLFGTVWGIMNSFIGISKTQTTNLAVVAPGIAEALLATAIGLVAAIPAVIIYNHFSRATRGYLDLVARSGGAVERLLSRDLDRLHGGLLAQAAE